MRLQPNCFQDGSSTAAAAAAAAVAAVAAASSALLSTPLSFLQPCFVKFVAPRTPDMLWTQNGM